MGVLGFRHPCDPRVAPGRGPPKPRPTSAVTSGTPTTMTSRGPFRDLATTIATPCAGLVMSTSPATATGLRTRSDDGSQAWFDGKRVVNNDGNHGMRSREGCVNTKKGWHKLVLTFYENGGGAGMQVSIKGPQTNNQWTKLTASMTTPRRP